MIAASLLFLALLLVTGLLGDIAFWVLNKLRPGRWVRNAAPRRLRAPVPGDFIGGDF